MSDTRSWDEKSLAAGEDRFISGNEHIITADDQVREEVHVHVFSFGAKWQRDQLRTDEAIERLANALCVEEQGMTLAEHEANCELPICGFRQSFLADARHNITALLGEDQ